MQDVLTCVLEHVLCPEEEDGPEGPEELVGRADGIETSRTGATEPYPTKQ